MVSTSILERCTEGRFHFLSHLCATFWYTKVCQRGKLKASYSMQRKRNRSFFSPFFSFHSCFQRFVFRLTFNQLRGNVRTEKKPLEEHPKQVQNKKNCYIFCDSFLKFVLWFMTMCNSFWAVHLVLDIYTHVNVKTVVSENNQEVL